MRLRKNVELDRITATPPGEHALAENGSLLPPSAAKNIKLSSPNENSANGRIMSHFVTYMESGIRRMNATEFITFSRQLKINPNTLK